MENDTMFDDLGFEDNSELLDLLERDAGGIDEFYDEDDTPKFKFDYKYSYACLGFTALSILKADRDILPVIIGIAPTPYLKLFIAEMDAFLEHMVVKLNDISDDASVSAEVKVAAENICNDFQANLNYFKTHYKTYLISKSYMKQVSDVNYDKYITDSRNILELMMELTIYRDRSTKYTVNDLNAILQHLIDFKFKQLFIYNLQTLHQIANTSKVSDINKLRKILYKEYSEVTFDDRTSAEEKSKYIEQYLSLVAFKDTPYGYTEDEVTALKLLDFPTQCIGMENALYSDFLSNLNRKKNSKALDIESFSTYTFFAIYNKKLQMKAAEGDTFDGLMYF